MANSINATSTSNGGIITTGDDSGVLNIQTNETTAISIDASQSVDFTNNIDAPNTFGFKNRLINGGMTIDQRNAGASVTPVNAQYLVDRFSALLTQSSKFTVQQNAGSVTPPAGFINYLGITSSSAYSVGSSDAFTVLQKIEGLNVADLGWGTANAKTVTLSFWVRSSLTGTFGGTFLNSAANRSYPFSYTISAANTWEQKAITVAGDTTGTWLTTNGDGIEVHFGLGVGSTYSGSANTWAGSFYLAPTGATSVVGTSGATFYITGVQLEKGTQATSFDFRSYGTELALCQRYYEVGTGYQSVRNPSIADNNPFTTLVGTGFQVSKRATPTMALGTATTSGCYTNSGNTVNINTQSFAQILLCQTGGAQSNMSITQPWTASSEL